MEIRSVDDIFAANGEIRKSLLQLLSGISEAEAATPVERQAWTIAQIVEHIAAVEESSSKICAKLLSRAQEGGETSDGTVTISETFKARASKIADIKVEAPAIVQPTGKTLAESITRMEENASWWARLRPIFNSYDGTSHKFPHPFFGPISAQEWLLLSGQHEKRHTKQIERLLNK